MKTIEAIILAGGKGSRLQRVVKDIPKPMAVVGEKPFLEYLIMQLQRSCISNIIISTGYMGDAIQSHFGRGDKWGVNIRYSPETEPLGTAGAVKKGACLVKGKQFIVMNGDSFFDFDMEDMLGYHDAKKGIGTVGLACVEDTSRYGRVEMDENGRIERFIEKGAAGSGFINAGVYLFERELVSHIEGDGFISLENEILPPLIGRGLFGWVHKGYFVDIGVPDAYLQIKNNPVEIRNALKKIPY